MRGRSRCLLRAANAAHVARVLSRRRSLAMLRAPPPACISVSFVCFAPRPRRPRLPRRRRRRLHRQLLEALWRCYHVRRDDVTDLPRADARAEHVLTATWLQAANQLSRRGVFVHVHGKSFCRNDFPSEATREVNKLSEHFALLLPHAHMHLGRPLSRIRSALDTRRPSYVHTRAQVQPSRRPASRQTQHCHPPRSGDSHAEAERAQSVQERSSIGPSQEPS